MSICLGASGLETHYRSHVTLSFISMLPGGTSPRAVHEIFSQPDSYPSQALIRVIFHTRSKSVYSLRMDLLIVPIMFHRI